MSIDITNAKASAARSLYLAFQLLRDSGGAMRANDLFEQIASRLTFSSWELEPLQKMGSVRWRSIMTWHSIDAVKAGFLRKQSGVWYITDEGLRALSGTPEELFNAIRSGYRAWKSANSKGANAATTEVEELSPEHPSGTTLSVTYDQAIVDAQAGIESYLETVNPYHFQDVCAALLRAMGYYTPFVAPKGRDGGLDIIAYADPLGVTGSRIKVQVKHRDQKATGAEVHQLLGLLKKDGEVGIFFSSGGFTPDAKQAARNSHIHIELIDQGRLIELWVEMYPRMPDADKTLLPLAPVYFVRPQDSSAQH